jgi:hypothetical protein
MHKRYKTNSPQLRGVSNINYSAGDMRSYTVAPYKSGISMRRDQTMSNVINSTPEAAHGGCSEDLFAEKFLKVTFRDYSNNTRMDIKNVNLKN